jgi:hypothetical protein
MEVKKKKVQNQCVVAMSVVSENDLDFCGVVSLRMNKEERAKIRGTKRHTKFQHDKQNRVVLN